MKANTHPQWNHNCIVTCACGNTFVTGSNRDEMQIDICSKCHPFFTGEMKFVDRQGRVDKFMKKMQAAQARQQVLSDQKNSKKTKQQPAEEHQSYKQLLAQQQAELKKAEKAVATDSK